MTDHSHAAATNRPLLDSGLSPQPLLDAVRNSGSIDEGDDGSSMMARGSSVMARGSTLRHRSGPRQRILAREAPFHQSNGAFNIRRKNRIRSLYLNDMFHSIAAKSTCKISWLIFALYAVNIVLFAGLYFLLSSKVDGCSIGLDSYTESLFFALETLFTIGYGTKDDPYFHECMSSVACYLYAIILRYFAGCDLLGTLLR